MSEWRSEGVEGSYLTLADDTPPQLKKQRVPTNVSTAVRDFLQILVRGATTDRNRSRVLV
jgi:hypothetical protein